MDTKKFQTAFSGSWHFFPTIHTLPQTFVAFVMQLPNLITLYDRRHHTDTVFVINVSFFFREGGIESCPFFMYIISLPFPTRILQNIPLFHVSPSFKICSYAICAAAARKLIFCVNSIRCPAEIFKHSLCLCLWLLQTCSLPSSSSFVTIRCALSVLDHSAVHSERYKTRTGSSSNLSNLKHTLQRAESANTMCSYTSLHIL